MTFHVAAILMLCLYPAGLLAWLVYDLVVVACYWQAPTWPTITATVNDLSHEYPAIPALTCLTLGLLLGHLFLQF
jgi:hypothetical protein